MRYLLVGAAVLAVALGLAPRAFGETDAQSKVALEAMTVAQLDAAADEARAQKDYPLAIRYFKAALRKDSKNPVLYNKLGLAELKDGDLIFAEVHFRKAVKADSTYAEAFNNLGAVEYMRKEYGKAAKHFKSAVALDETRATFHVNLGAAWFAQKRMDQAITEYARALELAPDILSNDVRPGVAAQIAGPEDRARYSYMLAKIHAKRGDLDECFRCLRIAKEGGYRDLGNVYRDEEFAGARQDSRLAEVVPPPAK